MDAPADPWLNQFLLHLLQERRLSVHTQSNYKRDLESLGRWLHRQGISDWADATPEHMRTFAAHAFRNGKSARTISRGLSAARTFYRYLSREQRVARNPVDGVSAPRASKRLPEALDADTMTRLLAIEGTEPLTQRDRAILELLYSSGLRLAELVGLDTGDISMSDRTVRVLGKGNKERIVPVGRQALSAITAWMQTRTSLAAVSEPALFVSQRGQRISPRAVQLRVRHWARVQGLDARVYPHLFRHSCATHVLESSRDLRGVQELLGHADIGTTQVYTHLDFQHLAQIYDQAHPRAKRRRDD
ncbi:MAG: tyrosine recombinase XerC [Pseudomonadota bacterium]